MVVDVSPVSYFAPIITFLLVALVVGVVIWKLKFLGESKWVAVFVALAISTLFISAGGAMQFVQAIVPWFALLLISVFFLMLLLGFIGKPLEKMSNGIGVVVVILFAILFLVSGFVIYSNIIVSYIPGPFYGYQGDPALLYFTDWLYSPRVVGAVLLLAVSALVSWILVKAK